MAGRAGRRGKDTQGIVILMVDSAMASEDAKNIIKVSFSKKLQSLEKKSVISDIIF